MAHRASSSYNFCHPHHHSPRDLKGYRETLPYKSAGARQAIDPSELFTSLDWFTIGIFRENSFNSRLWYCHGCVRFLLQCHSEELRHSAREPGSSGISLYRHYSCYLCRNVGQWTIACTDISLGYESGRVLDRPTISGCIRTILDLFVCCFGYRSLIPIATDCLHITDQSISAG
jgi:hypothetical protein